MTASVRRPKGGGAEPARPSSKSATGLNVMLRIIFSKLAFDRVDFLALKMSLEKLENRRSTAELDGMVVLYLMKRSINTFSPKKTTL